MTEEASEGTKKPDDGLIRFPLPVAPDEEMVLGEAQGNCHRELRWERVDTPDSAQIAHHVMYSCHGLVTTQITH